MQDKKKEAEKKTIVGELDKAMHSFMNNEAETAFGILDHLLAVEIPPKEQGHVQKIMLLLLAGTLYNINTLKDMLSLLGIKSNNYSKIWKKVSHKQVNKLFVLGSRALFEKKYHQLLNQSSSTQSRAVVTIIGDDSIFKQWIKDMENDAFYGKFYSGQFQKAVHGFCVSLVGVVMEETFYPLSFSLVPKTPSKTLLNGEMEKVVEKVSKADAQKTQKTQEEKAAAKAAVKLKATLSKTPLNGEVEKVEKVEKAEQKPSKADAQKAREEKAAAKAAAKLKSRKKSLGVLENGIKEVHNFLVEIVEKYKKPLPKFYVSIDSGFNNKELLDYCDKRDLITITVAKHTEVLFYKGKKMNFQTLIETIFEPAEKEYGDKNNEKEPFLLRLTINYQKLDRDVTILVFRFNGSKKVTVIFCYDKNIFKVTMRRHFFQRTQIEQFFRMVKHTLYINQSKSTNYKSFIKKVALFFLKAIFAFAFRDYCRKHFRRFKKYSFDKLQKNILYLNADKSILFNFAF